VSCQGRPTLVRRDHLKFRNGSFDPLRDRFMSNLLTPASTQKGHHLTTAILKHFGDFDELGAKAELVLLGEIKRVGKIVKICLGFAKGKHGVKDVAFHKIATVRSVDNATIRESVL
jgi:hypothetical protein